jgi:hypothetical protein
MGLLDGEGKGHFRASQILFFPVQKLRSSSMGAFGTVAVGIAVFPNLELNFGIQKSHETRSEIRW